MRRPILAILLLAGCGDSFHVAKKSCDTDYLSWAGGLTHSILAGGGDGQFDYDPDGTVQDRLAGGYALESGDFGWVTTYNAEHWRVNDTVAGYGYAKTDGDLDIQYWGTTVDVVGNSADYEIREKRVGCEVTRKTTVADTVTWHFGTFVDSAYNYRDESTYEGDPWVVEGTLTSDLDFSETVDFSQPGFSYASTRVGDGDGYSREDFDQTSNGTDYAGYYESFLDGSEHDSYTVDGSGTWDYTIDFEGNGSGTYTEGESSCDLTFTDGACHYDCGGGEAGDC